MKTDLTLMELSKEKRPVGRPPMAEQKKEETLKAYDDLHRKKLKELEIAKA